MSKRNRVTLKKFFGKGMLPSEDHFHDLIDSTLNTIDEGFQKTPEKGLEISSLGLYERLISLCRNDQPVWLIGYDGAQDTLLFKKKTAEGETLTLSLAADGNVGVKKKEPQYDLDVGGVIRATGRIGIPLSSRTSVPADGEWHNITDELSGCQAFEVVAGAGKPKHGKYAIVHTVAMNTFNPKGFLFNFLNIKKRIRCHHAYYRSFSDKLSFRWHGKDRKYHLQLRSNSDYGDGIRIRYYLTRLWFDEDMSESLPDLGSQETTEPRPSVR